MSVFERPLRPEDVGELLDLTVTNDPNTRSMADMQLQGVAALYNILCERPFAYLADEVGMGKTYQALGLAAVIWNERPDARILFISPRANLQIKWLSDYKRFFASNYRRPQGLGDDRVASVLFGEPVHRPLSFDNLRSWAVTLGMPEHIAPFLRHTSFTRPIHISAHDLNDLDALWHRTRQKLHSLGLFEVKRPKRMTPENASRSLNRAFAQALNTKLTAESSDRPYFDLVIVDEAQCLRNPDNQTNTVLFEALRGHAAKWLFMSATPAHGGPEDIPTIVNTYPDQGEALSPALAHDLPAMQRALQAFMIRRQRRYRTRPDDATVGKREYRHHDAETWGVKDAEMSALGTLAMGLVQKGLVDVLQGRSNRYRIGFLSSFESLQSSLLRARAQISDEEDEASSVSDWHRDLAAKRKKASNEPNEAEAPDTRFIHDLAGDFEACFGRPLPHPKIDSVVDRVAPLAFGTDDLEGGQKILIFTRRVSTVATLQARLTARHIASVEARVRRCWDAEIDWSGDGVQLDEVDGADDPENIEYTQGDSPLRRAMSRGGWLYRHRQTFRGSGRNALFFEDAWLLRLCQAGGVDPQEAAAKLPEEIWRESWTHAARASGKRTQLHRAARVRYLAVQGVLRAPEAFGLRGEQARPWREAYTIALHEHQERARPADDPHYAPSLFTAPTLWSQWDARFSGGPLALPAASSGGADVTRDALCERQVARTLLGQVFRLTDTLVDLFFAERAAQFSGQDLTDAFLGWLAADDPAAGRLRHECTQWLTHLRLIVDSSLDGAGKSWAELARQESWPQLFNPMPVLGVTGGDGGHRTATRQFRTPSLPQVLVCTDTLKEGVDLHLFCDRVLHYGVAWTSGDLEQRVGRVDRYFSQIERRLNEGPPPDTRLHVGYPHVVASLEREQVERVIERQRRAELLMNSPLAGATEESRTITVGAQPPRPQASELQSEQLPYLPSFPHKGHSVVSVPLERAHEIERHYAGWYEVLVGALHRSGWRITPEGLRPSREITVAADGRQHDLSWSFDAALLRYSLTVASSPWPSELGFSGGERRRIVGRERRVESFTRLLVPTPTEGLDLEAIGALSSALNGTPPETREDAQLFWGEALTAVGDGEVEWCSNHKARVTVRRGERAHTITLYAYTHGVRIVGTVAALSDLGPRHEWGETPTSSAVQSWARDINNELALGYLDVHPRDGLVFGVHTLHGALSEQARRRLLEEVAWRADIWEATLTGEDRW